MEKTDNRIYSVMEKNSILNKSVKFLEMYQSNWSLVAILNIFVKKVARLFLCWETLSSVVSSAYFAYIHKHLMYGVISWGNVKKKNQIKAI